MAHVSQTYCTKSNDKLHKLFVCFILFVRMNYSVFVYVFPSFNCIEFVLTNGIIQCTRGESEESIAYR